MALIAAGLILTSLYRQTVESAFDDRLGVYLKTLVGNARRRRTRAELGDPGNLGEQRFELLYSGWYWQVRDGDGGPVVLASRSLFSDVLDIAKATDTRDGRRRHHRRARRAATTSRSASSAGRSPSMPSHSSTCSSPATPATWTTRSPPSGTSVVLTLAVFGIGLVARHRSSRSAGACGRSTACAAASPTCAAASETRFEGPFPAEIEPLAKELNALLESNQEIIERARTQVGNLAHALKTPLSVITNEARANRGPARRQGRRAGRADAQPDQPLSRPGPHRRAVNVIGAVTEVEPVSRGWCAR